MPGYGVNGSDILMSSFTVGAIPDFAYGTPGVTGLGAWRILVSGDFTVGRIGTMNLFGRLEADNIFIGSIGTSWFVSGLSDSSSNYVTYPNDEYAIHVNGVFGVGQIDNLVLDAGISSTSQPTGASTRRCSWSSTATFRTSR